MSEIPKKYTPNEFEKEIYENWEKEGKFTPKPSTTGKKFYIPIPPPNVTGVLHLGHALTVTLEDIMVRYHRLKGDETLWVPGTDHAGLATQNVVERDLLSQGISKESLGREAFIDKIWDWKEQSHKVITDQIKKTGSSVSWEHERFTFDDKNNKLVSDIFVDLHKKGIIYRGEYMVNYCPKDKTVISDAEVVHKEEDGNMYEVTYFVSGSDKQIIIATTRPETLLGDQAVAVHPKDKRYKKLIGRNLILPIVNKEIPIIADEMVDMEFGTGAVKITPAHDKNDFEAGKRNDLTLNYRVIDETGTMMAHTGPFAGMNELEARKEIVEMLRSKGNLGSITPHVQKVGYSERGKARVQTIVSTQWFVDNSRLKEAVMTGWKKKEFEIVPERYGKVFEDWMDKLQDWCISRQVWWGHQIPAYYDKESGELLGVTQDPSELHKKYGEKNIVRDEDVLDTWFSSALWPFSVLDWDFENPSELFKKFYPADVLETWHDILLFWVIRMLLLGYEYTGEAPFKTIYLHGLLLDEKGRKFSKSLGNGIDPIELIEQYSADALRLSVVVGNTPGNNFKFSTDTVQQNQLFLNKLWNVARFVMMNIGDITKTYDELHDTLKDNYSELLDHEKWFLSRLRHTVDTVTTGMDEHNFSIWGEQLYKCTKDEFADYAIECFKITKEQGKHGADVLAYSLLTLLKLWHPYIPFITENLYGNITGEALIDNTWAKCDLPYDTKLEGNLSTLFDLVYQIRNIRGEKNIKPWDLVQVILCASPNKRAVIESNMSVICGLAKVESIDFSQDKDNLEEGDYAYGVINEVDIYIDMSGQDTEEEQIRIKKLILEKEEYVRALELKLTNSEFLSRAPQNVIRLTQEKKQITEKQLKKAIEQLEKLR